MGSAADKLAVGSPGIPSLKQGLRRLLDEKKGVCVPGDKCCKISRLLLVTARAGHSGSMPPASVLLGVVIEVGYELRMARRWLATS